MINFRLKKKGTTSLHEELGQLIARFVNKEAALIFGQGYATNSTNLPGLLGKVPNNYEFQIQYYQYKLMIFLRLMEL